MKGNLHKSPHRILQIKMTTCWFVWHFSFILSWFCYNICSILLFIPFNGLLYMVAVVTATWFHSKKKKHNPLDSTNCVDDAVFSSPFMTAFWFWIYWDFMRSSCLESKTNCKNRGKSKPHSNLICADFYVLRVK